jgi:hypothetical protein
MSETGKVEADDVTFIALELEFVDILSHLLLRDYSTGP